MHIHPIRVLLLFEFCPLIRACTLHDEAETVNLRKLVFNRSLHMCASTQMYVCLSSCEFLIFAKFKMRLSVNEKTNFNKQKPKKRKKNARKLMQKNLTTVRNEKVKMLSVKLISITTSCCYCSCNSGLYKRNVRCRVEWYLANYGNQSVEKSCLLKILLFMYACIYVFSMFYLITLIKI